MQRKEIERERESTREGEREREREHERATEGELMGASLGSERAEQLLGSVVMATCSGVGVGCPPTSLCVSGHSLGEGRGGSWGANRAYPSHNVIGHTSLVFVWRGAFWVRP